MSATNEKYDAILESINQTEDTEGEGLGEAAGRENVSIKNARNAFLGRYESLTDYAGRMKTLSAEFARTMPSVSGANLSEYIKRVRVITEHARQAKRHALEAIKEMVKLNAWAKKASK